ncbi:MAG: phosphoglucomutase/phosphomannomutase family protein [Anaerolineae bacterium]|nr:phosphoglucomutase/phosphomannomutase family protein [Anaerolineae bacterium]
MAGPIVFGTDGWRDRIAENYTVDNVRRVAQAFAHYLKSKGDTAAGVVIGYDNRFEAEHFAAVAAEVMAGNGIKAYLTERGTPTPIISYSVVDRQALGAINITASHNPPWDCGFKVRDHAGAAIAPDDLKIIEAGIGPVESVKSLPLKAAQAHGLVELFDAAPNYIERRIKPLVDLDRLREAGLNLVVDPMWGVGAGYFPRLIGGGKTRITEIHNIRNPIFPEMSRPEPIPPNVNVGLAKVKEIGADMVIMTDGDADRVGAGDENGAFLNQLQVYALLALYLLEIRGQRGAIVKTLSTTSMLNALGKLYDVPVYETGVGFKYVGPKMLETDAMMGGEESGGFAFRGLPERDGILAGLYLLDFVVRTGKKPSELLAWLYEKVGGHYYDRIDTIFDNSRRGEIRERLAHDPAEVAGFKVTRVNRTDGYKYELEGAGWLLIRFSGTEPLIRVYTETTRQDKVQDILQAGLALAGLK